MPIYEYVCQKCKHSTEVIQRVGERPLRICPRCGGKLKKAFSAPAIQFKGSGFYITDYPKGGKDERDSASPSGKSASGDSESGKSASGDSESGKSASGDSESGKSASGDSESGKSASAKSESGKSESGEKSVEKKKGTKEAKAKKAKD